MKMEPIRYYNYNKVMKEILWFDNIIGLHISHNMYV